MSSEAITKSLAERFERFPEPGSAEIYEGYDRRALLERTLAGMVHLSSGFVALGKLVNIFFAGTTFFNLAILVTAVACFALSTYMIHNRLDWNLAVLACRFEKWETKNDTERSVKADFLHNHGVIIADKNYPGFRQKGWKFLEEQKKIAEKHNIPHQSFFLKY